MTKISPAPVPIPFNAVENAKITTAQHNEGQDFSQIHSGTKSARKQDVRGLYLAFTGLGIEFLASHVQAHTLH